MNRRFIYIIITMLLTLSAIFSYAAGDEKIIKMSTTTSTVDSGILDMLLPEFTRDTGINVKVIAKGTGAAIRDGMDGNVDVIFVHEKEREEKFVSEGYGSYRLAVMHNDFIIIGPSSDPAGIKGIREAADALRKIADSSARFVSRGDDSGTHAREQELWRLTGLPMKQENTEIVKDGEKVGLSFVHPEALGERYMSIGQGMGKVITYAEEKQAYTLADRGTYLKYKFGREQGLDLEILCEGGQDLYNPYGVIPINPLKYPHVMFSQAERFAKWLVSEKAQRLIAEYKIEGHQAFFPDAIPDILKEGS
jgi:tungstate transport system substrate-binding protein